MKQRKKSQVIVATTLAIAVFGLILSVVGLSQTVGNLDEEMVSRTPEAVLANAGVQEGGDISLPVAYFDQRSDDCVNMYDLNTRAEADARQFEWTSCGYENKQIEQGIVDYKLGEDYLPVAVGGELVSNRGLKDMKRWFTNVNGKSKEYTGNLDLVYQNQEAVEFSFAEDEFYPLDTVGFSDGDRVNSDGHNHLFTMNFAIPFTVVADGTESFKIVADDDTFVFVGNDLAIDMGGIHEATTGQFMINEAGEIYTSVGDQEMAYSGIRVENDSIIRIFHADRDATESVLNINMTGVKLNIVQTQLANGSNGVQVAYDPTDPSYVGPLGETSTFEPDNTRGYVVMATVLGMTIVVVATFTAFLAHSLIRQKTRK